MLKLIDGFMPRLWPWLALALAALVVLQQLRVARLQVELAKTESAQAKAGQEQAQQAQVATEKNAGTLLQHAGNQQDNIYEYTQTIQKLAAGRITDVARIASLQHNLRTTATQHAQAASDLAACRSLGDRHQELATLVAEGAGLAEEGVGLVKQRDAEVMLLRAQVLTERAALERILSQ